MRKKLIGTRISESVAMELREYCKSHGILINHFEAIKTKLKKVKRDEEKKKEEKQLQRKRT
jgi:hypothetical protein